MKNLFTVMSLFLAINFGIAQTDLNYYLPKHVNYDNNIPTPKQVLGYEVGDWMVSHDQLVKYMETIAASSDRAIIEEYARSYENRPLLHLIFSTPENLAKLDQIKADHQKLADPSLSGNLETDEMPLVVVLGYCIHGNEASAVNASLLSAYYLAAGHSTEIDDLLENTIIIIDPALNPDGINRFANWVNMHKSFANLTDPNSRVFNEVYPGGRTNHYWFDLNRDYLLLTNPESRGRVQFNQEWLPNIVTDHHEMGSNSTFFFQPGVPSRNNPLTPQGNYDLTHAIAAYHAKHLDKIGSLYFSEEQFDDFYFGKGSSYPDINSGIGILFEQGSTRGFMRETPNGILTFPFAIRNQFTVTLSTLEAAQDLRKPLLDYQKDFYSSAFDQAKADPIAGWVFGDNNDLGKTYEFLTILNFHNIEFEQLKENYTVKGQTFEKETSYFISANQKNYRLMKSMFERSKSFKDKTFYDVSTWNFFYAFNMQYAEVNGGKRLILPKTKRLESISRSEGVLLGGEKAVAYAFRWNDYYAPKMLAALQAKGLKTKVAANEFIYVADQLNETFAYGTIIIPVVNQPLLKADLRTYLKRLSKENGIDIYSLSTSLTPTGMDIGSNQIVNLEQPKVLMFVDGRASSRDAGEIWHLFDQRYHMPISLVEQKRINRIDLNKYNTIVLPGGSFDDLGDVGIEKLLLWVKNGGSLITYKNSTEWAVRKLKLNLKYKNRVEPKIEGIPTYVNRRADANVHQISGAIFKVAFDPSHPLAYGLSGNSLPVFKTGTSVAELPASNYDSPFRYTETPLMSGYSSVANIDRIKNAPFIITTRLGQGNVISILDNTNFRGFWYGSNKIFANAVFFGQLL